MWLVWILVFHLCFYNVDVICSAQEVEGHMLLFNIVRGVLTLFLDWKDLIGDLFDDKEVNSICKALKEVEMDTCNEIVSVAF